MIDSINFTGKSNAYFAITKKGWGYAIPTEAYNQINNNRTALEKFARKNNIKITLKDAGNMLPESHSGSEIRFLSGKMAIVVEKRPSLFQKISNSFSRITAKFNKKNNLVVSTVPFFEKDSKNIPTLKEKNKIGFLVNYESSDNKIINTVVDFLQKAVGKKSDYLSNLK